MNGIFLGTKSLFKEGDTFIRLIKNSVGYLSVLVVMILSLNSKCTFVAFRVIYNEYTLTLSNPT